MFKKTLIRTGIVLAMLLSLVGIKRWAEMSAREHVDGAAMAREADLTQQVAALQAEVTKRKAVEDADNRLGQYAINMMHKSPNTVKNLSLARMQVLARSIVRVANDIFDNEDHRQAFISILQIESQFLRFAQSPTGPKGLAQLTRNTFHGAMANCGVKNLKDDDVWETDLNLYAGACYFKEQLVREDGNIFAAMANYNQGPHDAGSKSYSKSGDIQKLEPAKYLAKYAFLMTTTTDQKEPGVPAIDSLPKPTVDHNKSKTVPKTNSKIKAK